jgi:hypothetical protein
MKKWIIGLLVLLTFSLLFIYLLIPNEIHVNKAVLMPVKQITLYRNIGKSAEWRKWWPGEKKSLQANDTNQYRSDNKINYGITEKTITTIFVNITDGNNLTKSSLDFIPITTDTTKLEWSVEMPTSLNPFTRVKRYFFCKAIKEDIDLALNKVKTFYSSSDNLYSIKINREQVKDSFLVSTFDSSKGYPATELIYSMVNELKKYITSQSAVETGFPMLNIYTKDSITYLTRVAIPTDKKLASSGKISYKWMLGNGNILVAAVQGDNKNVEFGLKEMGDYVEDHNLVSPAIPFFSLITNRLAERDSTKWITKIYYPVMYYKD